MTHDDSLEPCSADIPDATAMLTNLSSEIEAGSSGVDAFFDLPAHSPLEIGRAVDITVTMPPLDGVAAVPQQSLHDNRHVYVVSEDRLQAIPVATHGTRRDAPGTGPFR